jgi:uncharacterized protein YkvS
MTFKEKLQTEHPECVDEKYGGGCVGCPDNYGYEKWSSCVWKGKDSEDCTKCWSREMPNEELVKTVPLPMPPITEPKKEVDAADYIEIYTDGHKKGYDEGLNDAWNFAMELNDELQDEEIAKLFGVKHGLREVMSRYTYEEAFAILNEYKEQRKIEVGDVVKFKDTGRTCVISTVSKNGYLVIFKDGSGGTIEFPRSAFDKTGKHIDIKSILEQIGE